MNYSSSPDKNTSMLLAKANRKNNLTTDDICKYDTISHTKRKPKQYMAVIQKETTHVYFDNTFFM